MAAIFSSVRNNRQIEDVEREFRAGQCPAASAGRMLASLEAGRERLEALPAEPAREEWEPAGITVRQHWAGLSSDDDRGHLLRTWGVRAIARRDERGEIHVTLRHGQPDGFEQATGLMLPHGPEDHADLLEVGGVLMHRTADGAYEVAKDRGGYGPETRAHDLMEPGELAEWIRRKG